MAETTGETITATWREESARLVGALTRMTRDLDLAEDLAQDALVSALESWPTQGIPDNPGAWLMTTAKRRAVDGFLVTETAMGQRISRAKKTLSEARVDFELPVGAERTDRLDDVMAVVYLIFNEGYTATSG